MHEHLDWREANEAGPADGLSWSPRQLRWLCCRLRPHKRRRSLSSRRHVKPTVRAWGRRPCPAAVHSGRESRRRSSTWTTSIRPPKGRGSDQHLGPRTGARALRRVFVQLGDRGNRLFGDRPRLGRQRLQQCLPAGRRKRPLDRGAGSLLHRRPGQHHRQRHQSPAGLELRWPGALWRRQSQSAGNGRHHSDFRQAIRRFQPAGPVLVRPRLVLRRR